MSTTTTSFFSTLPTDLLLNIFSKLSDDDDDPRTLPRLASVCSRFSSLIRRICLKNKCFQILPSLSNEIITTTSTSPSTWASIHKIALCCPGLIHSGVEPDSGHDHDDDHCQQHLASGARVGMSREQGNKLLASRFRSDVLYICDWPGCVHAEERRNYMLFRGVFTDFKASRVWRAVSDHHGRSRVGVGCAFCSCDETWDLQAAHCLRRFFGCHDDGEPVVRAFVCENGHVSGAWTVLPLYT